MEFHGRRTLCFLAFAGKSFPEETTDQRDGENTQPDDPAIVAVAQRGSVRIVAEKFPGNQAEQGSQQNTKAKFPPVQRRGNDAQQRGDQIQGVCGNPVQRVVAFPQMPICHGTDDEYHTKQEGEDAVERLF